MKKTQNPIQIIISKENQSNLELIETQEYKDLPENWDEGRYFSQFVPIGKFQEMKEKYLKRKNKQND